MIHLAAQVRSIGANRANPGRFFYENLMTRARPRARATRPGGEADRRWHGVLLPARRAGPFREESLWDGYPETNQCSRTRSRRRCSLVRGEGLSPAIRLAERLLLPTTCTAQEDSLDPDSSAVIPALIVKCLDAVERGERASTAGATARRAAVPVRRGLRARSLLATALRRQASEPRHRARCRIADLVARIATYDHGLPRRHPVGQANRTGSHVAVWT